MARGVFDTFAKFRPVLDDDANNNDNNNNENL